MARILGLDLGGHTIKGVLFDTAQRGNQVKAFGEVKRAEGDKAATLKAALEQLFSQHPLQAEQVVVALSGPSLATHTLSLPFGDAKRIDAALPFEVESQLPFDLSEAVFDYQIVGQKDVQRDKKSDLVVGVVRKEEMRSLLDMLAELKIDPRVVTHPALAYHGLVAGLELPQPLPEGEAVAIIDLGHERTTVAIGRPGTGIEFGRTFPGGGKDLTRALSNEFQIPLPDANGWKEEHGALASAVNGADAERAAGALVRGLQPTLREIRATFKGFTARTRRNVTRVYLCGGTSRMLGIDEQLTQDMGMPCALLPQPSESAMGLAPEVWPKAAQSYALAMRGQTTGARAPRFNLRRGDFAFKGDYDYVRDKIGLLVSFAATLLILLFASGLVRNSVLARRERQVDAMLCDVTQRVLGNCEKDYDRALNMLRGKESPAAALPRLSAVGLLAELTDRMPAAVPVKFDEMVIDTERITLRGETDSTKMVDQITTALKGYRCFHDVKQGKLEKSKTGQKVTFNLDIQVECPDQSQAPQF